MGNLNLHTWKKNIDFSETSIINLQIFSNCTEEPIEVTVG